MQTQLFTNWGLLYKEIFHTEIYFYLLLYLVLVILFREIVLNTIFMRVVRAYSKQFYFSQVHFNSKTFYFWRNILSIQKFGRDTVPNINKYFSSILSFVKTIRWSETKYNKLAYRKRSSIFVSVTIAVSTLLLTISARSSNLFLI